LVSTTTVFRITPPTVVVRSVIRPLQVHAPESVPGIKLVIPRGRPFLRPGWGRVRLAILPEDILFVELSPLTPRPGFRPHLLRVPALQMSQGGWWLGLPAVLVGVCEPLDSVVVRFTGGAPGPLGRDLILGDP